MTGSGESVLTTERSACVFTVVVCVEVLLEGVGSGVVLVTVATLVRLPETLLLTVAVRVMVAEAPAARVPMVHVGALHCPEGLALTKVRPVGSTSLTETLWASEVPLLVTTMV